MSAMIRGASPRDGSSNSSIRGRAMRPRAMVSICCSPPLREPPSCLARSLRTGKRSKTISWSWAIPALSLRL